MKILLAIVVDMYYAPHLRSFEYATFFPACVELGETQLYGYDCVERGIGRDEMNKDFLRTVAGFKPDVVLVLTWRDNFYHETLAQVPVPTIAWFSDSYREDHVREMAPRFSHCVAMDSKAEATVKELGVPVKRSMWACNPALHRPYLPGHSRASDIVWAGLIYDNRQGYIDALKAHLGESAVNSYDATRANLTSEDYSRLYGEAKIGLSFSRNVRGIPQPKARPFEVAGCEAMLMADKPNHLDGYFLEGKEYVGFYTVEELVCKASHYLQHDRARQRIAAAGHRRATREHTYKQRLEEVFAWALA